jgi:predicted RNA-binding Zn ribbon-like protein
MNEVLKHAESEQAAPPAARLVRDLVNTYEPQVDEDSIATTDGLQAWLTARGLLAAGAPLTPADVSRAVTVREGLRQVLLHHAGHEIDSPAVDALNRELASTPVRVAFTAGHPALEPTSDTPWDHVMAALLDAIRTSAEDGTWTRLKVCARDTCRWAFYDASRNQARRWCSMAGCGNHVKMKRAYAARKNRASQPSSTGT